MKILIAGDMEGITGVSRWEHVSPSNPEYTRFRKLMTEDVNAAVSGAFHAGADEIMVSDGHHFGQNLLIEELNQNVIFNNGTSSPWSMMNGIETGINAVICIGYHAKSGTLNAILAHTWEKYVLDLRINGQSMGEFGLNAMIAGYFGASMIMVSGDQALAEEARSLLPEVECAQVKTATGYYSGRCLTPEKSQKVIFEKAEAAVTKFAEGNGPQPLIISAPIRVEVDFDEPFKAEKAARLPGSSRMAGRTTGIVCKDVPDAFHAFRTLCDLADC